ncbi:Dihydroorotate dehydrogenase (fumarate) [Madurella mycetomatis]|uniref:Dihydroorotate dehydrogenase (fumarate) n=1 Tax=Madurella mycetomatis TaxID=100816 RepID=A0A175WI03_9PEZI|nr:Dihydroorotate dehydrogenase (fumarate) [Madurella mycetomatis]KXX83129.1 Dihydroorotate dehydrogenase (fumarate) [Madurella mycetomatis]
MTGLPPPLEIHPPLTNSANPWATTLDDLRSLYASPSTGAVTTRTSLIQGFDHDPAKHQYTFFDPSTHRASPKPDPSQAGPAQSASINSLGYSPLPLETYLSFIKTISDEQQDQQQQLTRSSPRKGFIISVTGTPDEVAASYKLIASATLGVRPLPVAMEINLSCPNIPNHPPPAYSRDALAAYLEQLQRVFATADPSLPRIPVGLKTPPYTHAAEYEGLMAALERAADGAAGGLCPVSFITATNTLGSCLVFAGEGWEPSSSPSGVRFALPGAGMGGMAGAPLHPLALGNVCTIRRMLDERRDKLGHVKVVGVGGVLDAQGYRRMRAVGAYSVGVGTGLGSKGVGIFGEIEAGLGGRW